jgi:hypothetical protein
MSRQSLNFHHKSGDNLESKNLTDLMIIDENTLSHQHLNFVDDNSEVYEIPLANFPKSKSENASNVVINSPSTYTSYCPGIHPENNNKTLLFKNSNSNKLSFPIPLPHIQFDSSTLYPTNSSTNSEKNLLQRCFSGEIKPNNHNNSNNINNSCNISNNSNNNNNNNNINAYNNMDENNPCISMSISPAFSTYLTYDEDMFSPKHYSPSNISPSCAYSHTSPQSKSSVYSTADSSCNSSYSSSPHSSSLSHSSQKLSEKSIDYVVTNSAVSLPSSSSVTTATFRNSASFPCVGEKSTEISDQNDFINIWEVQNNIESDTLIENLNSLENNNVNEKEICDTNKTKSKIKKVERTLSSSLPILFPLRNELRVSQSSAVSSDFSIKRSDLNQVNSQPSKLLEKRNSSLKFQKNLESLLFVFYFVLSK